MNGTSCDDDDGDDDNDEEDAEQARNEGGRSVPIDHFRLPCLAKLSAGRWTATSPL